jgi:aspartate/methionine/tyrosine aminotransferase
MKIPPFELERYFARYEFSAPYLLCSSDCQSLSIGELLSLEPTAEAGLKQVWLGYTEYEGAPELRAELTHLYTTIAPNQLLVHAGAEEAIFSFMNVALNAGDHVIVHDPCYQSLFSIAEAIGCEVTRWRTIAEQKWEPDLDWLKQQLRPHTKAVIINCPHNPTGYLMSYEKLMNLVKLSQQHGFIIFSDEVCRFLEYCPADRLPAVCDIDDRAVSLGAMAKSFGLAGLRIGWIATHNNQIYQQMAAFKDYTSICNSAPSEFLALVALRQKEQLFQRNLEIIKHNLTLLDRFFAQQGDRMTWSRPKAGPIAFPALSPDLPVDEFCHQLVTQAGVLLLPGSVYAPEYNHFRIGFGRANLPECLEQFTRFWLCCIITPYFAQKPYYAGFSQ